MYVQTNTKLHSLQPNKIIWFLYAHTHTCTHTHTYMYTHTHTHTHTHTPRNGINGAKKPATLVWKVVGPRAVVVGHT